MAASFIEIKRDIGRKTPICNILLVFNLHDPLHPFEFLVKILKQTVWVPGLLGDAKNIAEKFKSMSTVQQR